MMLYNKPPFYPNSRDGPGILGITNAVKTKMQIYDKNVNVSELGKDFMNMCLKKQIN